MKQITGILFIAYYLSGTFCLPLGDFYTLTDLPAMYRHCKETEDKDLTPFDFIKDHLLNIDCLFDKHGEGDDQKPHTPYPFNHQEVQVSFMPSHTLINVCNPAVSCSESFSYISGHYFFSFSPDIFHPPAV
jgi:hypothetical protein